MSSFSDRSKAEVTANVMFLFQRARWVHTGLPYSVDGDYGHDGEGVLLGDSEFGIWIPRPDSDYLTNEQLAEMETVDGVPCAIKTWDTASVWLTREEAESHGEAFSYRHPDGWRVFGVPAMGALPTLISAGEKKPAPVA